MLFKKSVLKRKDQKKNFVQENLRNSIINENVLDSEDSLMYYKGHPNALRELEHNN